MTRTLTFTSTLPASAAEAFAWHKRPGAFERLNPPWEPVEVISKSGGIENGAEVTLRVPAGPMRQTWKMRHEDYQEGKQFCDVMLAGPFEYWRHVHSFEATGADSSIIKDEISYRLPFHSITEPLVGWYLKKKISAVFHYRHQTLIEDLKRLNASASAPRMRIAVSGASGLVATALIPFLQTAGHEVLRFVRTPSVSCSDIYWNYETGQIDLEKLEGVDAVIHLAGENIAGGPWSVERKNKIRDSRVKGTKLLAEALTKLAHKPKVFICASAIGFYGNRGDEILNENSKAGSNFLADVCRDWEAATLIAEKAGIRTVQLRNGIVLSPRGGALQKMLLPFKLGIAGRLGSGKQYMSWIGIDDLVYLIYETLINQKYSGAVNAVSPNPVTNSEFTKVLAGVLSRPAILPVPEMALRAIAGELADALLLGSARVVPEVAMQNGFVFSRPGLREALGRGLGSTLASVPNVQL